MFIRERISGFFGRDVEVVDAVPQGRFLRNAEKVLRLRAVLGRDFPLFEGHFPGHPVLPALGHVLLARSAAERLAGGMAAIAAVAQAKFLSPVEPGAVLDVFAAPPRERDGDWLFLHVRVADGEAVEAARIRMTLRPT